MCAKTGAQPQTVEDYLATLPDDARAALEELRKTIKTVAPQTTETISYQIPTFKHHGPLVAFAAFEKHCGFYVMSPAVMRAHEKELRTTTPARARSASPRTIRFRPRW